MVSPIATTKTAQLRDRGEPGMPVFHGIRHATASGSARRIRLSCGLAAATRRPMGRPASQMVGEDKSDVARTLGRLARAEKHITDVD